MLAQVKKQGVLSTQSLISPSIQGGPTVLRPSIDRHSIEVRSIRADFGSFPTLARLGTIGSI